MPPPPPPRTHKLLFLFLSLSFFFTIELFSPEFIGGMIFFDMLSRLFFFLRLFFIYLFFVNIFRTHSVKTLYHFFFFLFNAAFLYTDFFSLFFIWLNIPFLLYKKNQNIYLAYFPPHSAISHFLLIFLSSVLPPSRSHHIFISLFLSLLLLLCSHFRSSLSPVFPPLPPLPLSGHLRQVLLSHPKKHAL